MNIIVAAIGLLLTLCGVAVSFGVLKAKIAESASKRDLAAAIKRSDEMLELMRNRAEEDRRTGEGHYKEIYGIINAHSERLAAVETSQNQLSKMIDKLEGLVSGGFRDLRQDIKELREEVKHN